MLRNKIDLCISVNSYIFIYIYIIYPLRSCFDARDGWENLDPTTITMWLLWFSFSAALAHVSPALWHSDSLCWPDAPREGAIFWRRIWPDFLFLKHCSCTTIYSAQNCLFHYSWCQPGGCSCQSRGKGQKEGQSKGWYLTLANKMVYYHVSCKYIIEIIVIHLNGTSLIWSL